MSVAIQSQYLSKFLLVQLQAGFTEQPDVVDFKVRVMGGSTLAGLVPSLKAWFVRLTRDSIISYYVLPEQWTYRLAPVSTPSFFFCSVNTSVFCLLLMLLLLLYLVFGVNKLAVCFLVPVRSPLALVAS